MKVIAKGGDINEAQGLMDAARRIEGARVFLPTSIRTNEIIHKVLKKKGDGLAQLEKEQLEAEQKRQQEEAEKVNSHTFYTYN